MNPRLIPIVLGTTASGKSSAAMALAKRHGNIELISLDSMKIYRGMDIGTNKPSPADRAAVPWHLLDVADPADTFNATDFVRLADAAVADIERRGRQPLLVGGTALYLMGFLEGFFAGPGKCDDTRQRLEARAQRDGSAALHAELAMRDPVAATRLHPNDRRRIIRALEVIELTGRPISALQHQWDRQAPRRPCVLIGLRRDKAEEDGRSDARVVRMFEHGLVDEVRRLLDNVHTPRGLGQQAAQAIGYAEVIAHLRNELSLHQALRAVQQNTRRLAKSQRTWWKRIARHHPLRWIQVPPEATPDALADDIALAMHQANTTRRSTSSTPDHGPVE